MTPHLLIDIKDYQKSMISLDTVPKHSLRIIRLYSVTAV
jgi:hypothetical protein